jgi:hypothetical protein
LLSASPHSYFLPFFLRNPAPFDDSHPLQHMQRTATLQHIAIFKSLDRTAKPSKTLQHTATHCNTLQHIINTATHCDTLQHTAARCKCLFSCETAIPYNILHCNTLQHTATHCNTLQLSYFRHNRQPIRHNVSHCNALQNTAPDSVFPSNFRQNSQSISHEHQRDTEQTSHITLQHTATPCDTLQHTASATFYA